MSGGRYRVAATLFVTISVLLQIGSIVSPGWMIDVQGNTEEYKSIFYKMTCTTKNLVTLCPAKSYHSLYKETKGYLDFIKAGPIPYIELDKKLHDDVQEMILLMAALLCTSIAFIAQMVRTCNRDKDYKRIVVVSPLVIALADGLMISVIIRRVIYNHHLSQIRDLDGFIDHTYAGFPYSVAIYVGALLANTLAAMFNTCQSTGSLKKPRQKRRYDDLDDMVPVEKKLPVSQTIDVKETPKSVKQDNAFDNPTFSVKL